MSISTFCFWPGCLCHFLLQPHFLLQHCWPIAELPLMSWLSGPDIISLGRLDPAHELQSDDSCGISVVGLHVFSSKARKGLSCNHCQACIFCNVLNFLSALLLIMKCPSPGQVRLAQNVNKNRKDDMHRGSEVISEPGRQSPQFLRVQTDEQIIARGRVQTNGHFRYLKRDETASAQNTPQSLCSSYYTCITLRWYNLTKFPYPWPWWKQS